MKKNLIDLHTHSVLSRHAYSSLTENIEYAAQIGLKVYGISEHQPDEAGVDAHKYAFSNCARITPKKVKDTKILVGIELNILDGHFDTYDIFLDKLSYCIASMHGYAYPHTHSYDDNTKNYIMACNTPYVKIIGHLDYPNYPCDYEKIVKEAKKNNVLIELNNASLDPHGSRVGAEKIDEEILSYCIKYDEPIILGSDAHIKYEIGNVDFCNNLLERINFPEELIVNYNDDLFYKYFKLR